MSTFLGEIIDKVLVTGADCFIGSHSLERLMESGYNVKAFVIIIFSIPGDGSTPSLTVLRKK